MATLSSREGLKKRESRERTLVLTVLFVGPGSAKVCVKRRDVFEFRQQRQFRVSEILYYLYERDIFIVIVCLLI